MAETFRIIDEPLSFQEKAFIALAAQMVRTKNTPKGREVSCDMMAAWDLSKACSAWRDKMKKEDDK